MKQGQSSASQAHPLLLPQQPEFLRRPNHSRHKWQKVRLIYNVIKVTGKKLHIKREKAYYTNVQISVQSSYHCLLPSSPRFVSWARSWSSGLGELSVKEGRAAEPTFKNVLLKTSVICKVIFSFLMELLLWLVISLKNYLHNTLEKESKALASGGRYSGIKRETSGSGVLRCDKRNR